MAAIAHGQNFSAGQHQTQSATYVTAVSEGAGSFVDNATYFLMVTLGQRVLDATDKGYVRVVRGSTELPGSEQVLEMASGTNHHLYSYSTVFTQPATAEAITVEYRVDGSSIHHLYDIIISWIRLDADLVQNSDWYFAEDNDEASPVELPLAFGTEFTSLTFTPANNNDDWLVIASYNINPQSATRQFDTRLNRDDIDLTPYHSFEGEDNAQQVVQIMPRVYTLDNTSHTFRFQALEEAAPANHMHRYSSIFALRLNAFDEHHFDYQDGQVAEVIGWQLMANPTPFTPNTAGDFFLLGYAGMDIDSESATGYLNAQIEINGTTDVPVGYNIGNPRGNNWDAADRLSTAIQTIENLSTVSQDIEFWTEGANTGNWEHRLMLAFSMELPAGNNRRGQVSWAEFEIPTAPRRGQVSWAEFEIPTAPRRGQVSWAEVEIPNADRIGFVSWAEFEAPNPPRRGQVSFAEFELPELLLIRDEYEFLLMLAKPVKDNRRRIKDKDNG